MSLTSDTTDMPGLPTSTVSLELLLHHLLDSYVPNPTAHSSASDIREMVALENLPSQNGIFAVGERQALVFAIDPTNCDLQKMDTDFKNNVPGDYKLFIFIHISQNSDGTVIMPKTLVKELCNRLRCWHHTFLFLPPDLWTVFPYDLVKPNGEDILSSILQTLYVQIGGYRTRSPVVKEKEGGEYDIHLDAPIHHNAFQTTFKTVLANKTVLSNLCCDFHDQRRISEVDTGRALGRSLFSLSRIHSTPAPGMPLASEPRNYEPDRVYVISLKLDSLTALTRLHVFSPTHWGNICYALDKTRNNLQHIIFSSNTYDNDRVQTFSPDSLDIIKLKIFHMTIKDCALSVKPVDTALKVLCSLKLTGLEEASITWTGTFVPKSESLKPEQLAGFVNEFVTCLEKTVGDAKRGCIVTIRHFDRDLLALMKAKMVPPGTNDADKGWKEVIFPELN